MSMASKHRILNSRNSGRRPDTLPLDYMKDTHDTKYLRVGGEEIFEICIPGDEPASSGMQR